MSAQLSSTYSATLAPPCAAWREADHGARRACGVARRLVLVTAFFVGCAGTLTPAASSATWRSCKGFTYQHQAAGMEYRFHSLRAKGVSCRTVRGVIRAYFRGEGRAVNPDARAEGFVVRGWKFWIGQSQVDGSKRGKRFVGAYR